MCKKTSFFLRNGKTPLLWHNVSSSMNNGLVSWNLQQKHKIGSIHYFQQISSKLLSEFRKCFGFRSISVWLAKLADLNSESVFDSVNLVSTLILMMKCIRTTNITHVHGEMCAVNQNQNW